VKLEIEESPSTFDIIWDYAVAMFATLGFLCALVAVAFVVGFESQKQAAAVVPATDCQNFGSENTVQVGEKCFTKRGKELK